MAGSRASLTSGSLIARNTLFNLLGSLAPLLVALVAVPLLITGLGTPRFALLTLVWTAVGCFGLFDFGLGRALVQLVAERLGAGAVEELGSLVWTALLLIAVLAALGAACLWLAAPWLVDHVLNVPSELRLESVRALRWGGIALPFAATASGLRGILEAHQRFDLVTGARVVLGVLVYAGPLLTLPFTASVVPVVVVLVLVRAIDWLAHLALCLRAMPALRGPVRLTRASVRPLVSFGSWIMLSNVLSPIMVYLDRFVVAGLLSVSAVAYYVTPYEVAVRLLLIPSAVLGVLFPAFASSMALDPAHAARLFDRAVRLLSAVLFPAALVVVFLGRDGLDLWVGPTFARESTRVLQWLTVGVVVNALAWVPVAVIQAAGRSDIPAKVHLAEVPCYLLALWWLVTAFGVEGAAMAWLLRAALDAVVMFSLAVRFLPVKVSTPPYLAFVSAPAALGVLAYALPAALVHRAALLAVSIALCVPVLWLFVLGSADRAWMRGWIGRINERAGAAR